MKKLYKIKQRCMIDLCIYDEGQEIMIDDSKFSKSLMEEIEYKTDKTEKESLTAEPENKSFVGYENKMINPETKTDKVKTKVKKLFKKKKK